jgi:hypothetical protein
MRERPSGELLHHLLLFARRLKGKGFKITTGRVIDAARSLPYLDLSRRQDFAAALRANWASSPGEFSVFDDLFRVFWSQFERRERKPVLPSAPELGSVENGGEKFPFLFPGEIASPEPEGPGRVGQGLRYSPEERLMAKDFTRLTAEETPRFARTLQRLLSRWAARISRRRRPSGRGREIDFRRTLRTAVGHGGEMVRLIRKRARVKPLKIITICDVSGSMDSSTRFTLQFIHGMHRVFRRSETFVFSTRLTRISDLLKRNRWPVALKAIGERVQDWSGGTRIGQCLKVFNERYGKGLAAGSFLLVIISDGWDRGDALTLETEMKRLRRRARRIVWMNPLLETPGYQSLCLGMRTALPFIDHFIPANSLENFQDLGEIFIPRRG